MTALAPDLVREIEERAGIDSLGDLHARRRQLLIALAPLAALHGPFGKWDDKRKQMLEAMKVKARMGLTTEGVKITESLVDATAYADEQYARFVDDGISGHIDYLNMNAQMQEIVERISSREAELYVYGKEAGLAR